MDTNGITQPPPTVADVVDSSGQTLIKIENLPYLPKKYFLCPVSKIRIRKVAVTEKIDTGRVRRDFDHVPALSQSLKEMGMIQPIILEESDKPEEYYWLMAGESRLRAAIMAGYTEVPAILRDQATPRLAKTVELEENLRRKDMSFTEKALGMRQLHLLKQSEHGESGKGLVGGWSKEQTGLVVNESPTSVARYLKIANAIADNPELHKALEAMPMSAALKKLENDKAINDARVAVETGKITVNANFVCGDATELIKSVADATVQSVITDPPFGIGQIDDEVGSTRGSSQTYTASLKQTDNLDYDAAVKLISTLAPDLYRVLKPGGFVYMFCSITIMPAWMKSLADVGFDVDPVPLIWDKERSTTLFQGFAYPASYEPVIFAQKPPKGRQLLNPKVRNVLRCPRTSSQKKTHPFQKPAKLIAQLIRDSTVEGELVLDPFAASAITLGVAKALKRNAVGFELNKEHWVRSQMSLETMGFEGGAMDLGEIYPKVLIK